MEFNSPPVLPFIGNPFPLNDLSTLQGLVGRLCEEIGFATNVEVHDVKSGSKYNIILFTCLMTSYGAWPLTQRNYCVLRTSKVKHHASNWKDVEMGRLAAFHTYSLMPMPVPLLFAWDMTYDNCIQCSYIIQEQVHGQNLSEHYLRLNTIHNNDLRLEADEAEDYATLGLTLSAVIEHQEQAYHFSHYGTLQLGAGMVLKSSGVNGIIDRIPLHVKPFMQGGIAMRTNTKVIDFILELLNGQETQVRTALHENKYRKILDIALCLKNLEDENHPRIGPSHPSSGILTSTLARLW
ncbi:hypothetical protein EYC84_004948 [Monilinia fructicola]|uniref:Uncharacterized protein n=1 Tax=Monilinia fructicola TaxID=38448 RepID=A0A5M9K4L4_MONFR|nr:hypothetical protein EYC84_004948 [Monilinia fructicola]